MISPVVAPRDEDRAEFPDRISRKGLIGHRSFSALFAATSPSVVNIFTTKTVRDREGDIAGSEEDPTGMLEKFFGTLPRDYVQRSLGTGFIVDRRGHILTNDHVIESAEEIKVKLWNEKEYDAKLVGRDPATDLALIRVDGAPDLRPVKLGDSERLKVGEWVAAIGNPFSLTHSITIGIVSAKGRRATDNGAGYFSFIQTDAAINPGNSGGPLLDLRGTVVGINTAIGMHGQGISFSIPINVAREVLPQLKAHGRVVRGWLGVYVQRVTRELAQSFGLPRARGSLVSGVVEDGPAAQAKIRAGDIVVQFGRHAVIDSTDLPYLVSRAAVGAEAKVTVVREGKRRVLQVKLGRRPQGEEPTTLVPRPVRTASVLGLNLVASDKEGEPGVVVESVLPGGVAFEKGLRAEDVILEVNGKPVSNLESYRTEYAQIADGQVVRLRIKRGGANLYIGFKYVRE